MKRIGFAVLLCAMSGLVAIRPSAQPQSAAPARTQDYRGWPAYGGTVDQIRYSSLTQINRDNVKQLQVAWTYDSEEAGGLDTQPIVADGLI